MRRDDNGFPTGFHAGWAYGMLFTGLPDARLLMPAPPGAWPGVHVRLQHAETVQRPKVADDYVVVDLLAEEFAVIDRQARTATLRCRMPATDGRVVHPFLTAAATAFAWWGGQSAFHGGAFASERGAWALLGEQEAGKSTLLAALGLAGRPVLSDDLLVVEGNRAVFAGPRCIDLRPGASAVLQIEDRVLAVRGGERFRVSCQPVRHQTPLCGWIALGWSDRLELRPLAPGERLRRLTRHHSFPPTDPTRLIELARLPGFELLRPRSWRSLEPAVDALLELSAR